MKERIRQIMEAEHMTQQSFAQHIDMAPATLSSIFNGRTKPTLNIVEAITKKFPYISVEWLMFGTGDMRRPSSDAPTPAEEVSDGHLSSPNAPLEPTLDFGGDTPASTPYPQNAPLAANERMGVKPTHRDVSRTEIKIIDKPQRQITEIRVYFDDLTFETFVPAKK